MANSSPAHSAVAVDASYLVRLLLPWEQNTSLLDRFTKWRQDRVDICAPDLLVAEVTSVFRQAVYREWITAAEGQVRSTVFWKNFLILNYAMNRSCWLDEKDCTSPRYKT
jgi:predicted nucleic acid-binding protein